MRAEFCRHLPRDMKKCSGYKSLKLKSVNMTSHENEPLSTKSPLNSYGFVKERYF